MSKVLLWGLALAAAGLLTLLSVTARPYRTDREDMVQIREQVRPETRLGFHDLPENGPPRRWSGVLLDAGCPTREMFAPGVAAMAQPAAGGAAGAAGSAAGTAGGAAARAVGGVVRQGVPVSPEVVSRQIDAGCAVTGTTRGFALYLPSGELKNLDEGGNTMALEAFQDTPVGRAVMAGEALAGANPRAEITGRQQGDRLIVEEIRLL